MPSQWPAQEHTPLPDAVEVAAVLVEVVFLVVVVALVVAVALEVVVVVDEEQKLEATALLYVLSVLQLPEVYNSPPELLLDALHMAEGILKDY